MADPCRQIIKDRVVAILQGIATIPGLTVEAERIDGLTGDDLPKLVVYDAGDETDNAFTGEDGWILALDIEGRAQGDTDALAASAIAQLQARAQQAIFADYTLGIAPGVRNLEEDPEAPLQRLLVQAEVPTAGFTRRLRVSFATAEGDPFTFV
jgi:hypothetical protein